MKLKSISRRAWCATLFLSLLVMVGLLAPRAGAGTAGMDDANRAFAEGRYEEAAQRFEELVRTKGYSGPLLFDLGNAYLRSGKPVRATLAYERALILAPRDPAILKNLATAQSAGMVTERRSPFSGAAHLLSMSTWAWIVSGGFWCTLGLIGGGAIMKRYRTPLLAAAGVGLLTLGTSGGALVLCRADLHRGLVMVEAPILVSPFTTAQSDFALAAGSAVELGATRDGYVFVHDSSGRSGWLERAQVEPIVAPRS